jgi:hypothetical protein
METLARLEATNEKFIRTRPVSKGSFMFALPARAMVFS